MFNTLSLIKFGVKIDVIKAVFHNSLISAYSHGKSRGQVDFIEIDNKLLFVKITGIVELVLAVVTCQIIIRHKCNKETAFLDMGGYILVPFASRRNPVIIPYTVAVFLHTFDNRQNSRRIFVGIAYKNIRLIAVVRYRNIQSGTSETILYNHYIHIGEHMQ